MLYTVVCLKVIKSCHRLEELDLILVSHINNQDPKPANESRLENATSCGCHSEFLHCTFLFTITNLLDTLVIFHVFKCNCFKN